MHFRVEHTTRYTYSRPVTLGPHTIRLRPRVDGSLRLARYQLQVQPAPALWSESLDLEGNAVTEVGFDQPVTRLTIVSAFEASARRHNPFDYVVTDPAILQLPARYEDPLDGPVAVFTRRTCRSAEVLAYAQNLAAAADQATLPFLTALAADLHGCEKYVREDGAARSACQTLRLRAGACRDLAVLFIEACRAVGLAARFVSGYWRGARPADKRFLHAWAEVYLPGAGWRGYDASLGLAVSDGHIPVAAGAHPAAAAPVTGSYRGDPAGAGMEWNIAIQIRA